MTCAPDDEDPRHCRRADWLRILATASALIAAVIALLALIGWALASEWLAREMPGALTMNPLTALLMLLAAISLRLESLVLSLEAHSHARHPRFKSEPARRCLFAAAVMAVIVSVVGSIKVLGYMCGIDVPIDRWLLTDMLAHAEAAGVHSRMPLNSALNFALLGAALFLLASRMATRVPPRYSC